MNYKELKQQAIDASKPRYDEKSGGIFIPALGIIFDIDPLSEAADWYDAMEKAKDAGKRLPTIDDLRYIDFYKKEINAIIQEHGGTPLSSCHWSSTEGNTDVAWFVGFSSGITISDNKEGYNVVRAVADV